MKVIITIEDHADPDGRPAAAVSMVFDPPTNALKLPTSTSPAHRLAQIVLMAMKDHPRGHLENTTLKTPEGKVIPLPSFDGKRRDEPKAGGIGEN